MGKKVSFFLAAMVGLLGWASIGQAIENLPDITDGNDRNDSSYVQPSSFQGQVIQLPVCKNEGSSLICRWDNLQIDYINTRLTTATSLLQIHTLTIKAKDKEISLVTIPDSKAHYVNAIAGCERMAIASRAGQGLFSFYVIANSSAISQTEAAFQNNKVNIGSMQGLAEIGCFLSAAN